MKKNANVTENKKSICLIIILLIISFEQPVFSAPLKDTIPPNIILIISDDQGCNDLGAYGRKDIQTPTLDKLAADGVRLTSFYVTGSTCTPSRSGLLTGRYPQRNGTYELFRNNEVNYGHRYTEYEYSVSPERVLGTDLREVFISQVLKSAGYINGYVGKWDLGQLKRFLPLQRGFDYYYGFATTGIDYFTHERYGVPQMLDGNTPTTKDKGVYSTYLFEREAISFLNKNKNSKKPFFLYLSFNAPHVASTLDSIEVQAPEEYLQKYPKGTTKAENDRRKYMAAVTCMDDAIKNILQVLKESGKEDNTLVIFLSDNGGSKGANNSPYRGGKTYFFEGGTRMPCIIKWPGYIKPGTVNDGFLTSLELFPTIVSAAGAQLPHSVIYDGFNMLPFLEGKVDHSARRKMFWEARGDHAARIDNWKLVVSKRGGGLFDLSNDISEKNDLSSKHPRVLKMVKSEFEKWKKEMEDASPRGPFKNF